VVIKLAVVHSNREAALEHDPIAAVGLELLDRLVELDVADSARGHGKNRLRLRNGMEWILRDRSNR
jgi:hypothetical protein